MATVKQIDHKIPHINSEKEVSKMRNNPMMTAMQRSLRSPVALLYALPFPTRPPPASSSAGGVAIGRAISMVGRRG